ncbi:hypothetical protein VPH46_06990 [Sphingomonas sp. MJ1 (PH-R8)]|uniref:hypothetical protein n=1 Tax=Sphingomonas sp. MJ1 (PH-R8) TaxID=3112950 RepID=UPI003A840EC2
MAGTKTLQKMIELYKVKTGVQEMDPVEIAKFAVQNGVELPAPVDPMKRLVKQISEAAREVVRTDRQTGRPYRAYHSLPIQQGQETFFFWVDIDDATRPQMVRSSNRRREQVVGELVQHTFDLDHWAAVNPNQEPIYLEKDFNLDVEIRKASDGEGMAA